MKQTILFFLVIIFFSTCKDTVLVEDNAPCLASTRPEVSYAKDIYPIISRTCAIPQCHTTDFEYGNFNKFEEFQRRADKVKFKIENHLMPHSFTDGPSYLANCEIELISKWIREGATNN
jgi:hypothetical protein